MKKLLKIFSVVVLVTTILSSCDNDPDNLYGKNKPMKILDENGKPAVKVYPSIVSGTTISIVGGVGDHHTIEVEDEELLTYVYFGRASNGSMIPVDTYPAHIKINPKDFGSTTIRITDEDINKTIEVEVEVIDEYKALTIKESNIEALAVGTKIVFMYRGGNEYHFVTKSGKEYESFESGTYDFERGITNETLMLTLDNGNEVFTWKISDADNNKNGYKYYISDVVEGLNFPKEIITRFSPAESYPCEFLFTDTSNPERWFKTGRVDTTIKKTFF